MASFLLFFWGAILTVGRLVGDLSFGDGVLELNIFKSSFRSFEESANVWTHPVVAYLRALTWRTIAALKSTRRAAGYCRHLGSPPRPPQSLLPQPTPDISINNPTKWRAVPLVATDTARTRSVILLSTFMRNFGGFRCPLEIFP